MKKMNIRQAFAKMKKMFPGAYITAEKSYTLRHGGEVVVYCQLYMCRLQGTSGVWALSKPTFEEAFEELEKRIKEKE